MNTYYPKPQMNKPLKITITVIGIIVAFLAAFLLIFSEFISVKELGDAYLGVFLTNLKVNVIAKVISFITIFILFYIHFIQQNLNKKKYCEIIFN